MKNLANILWILLASVTPGLTLSLCGCAHESHESPKLPSSFTAAPDRDESNTRYIIDPPDEIVMHAFNIKEVDGMKQLVRPDGSISVGFFGNLKVAGITPQQAEREINSIASKYYREPEIRVEVIAKSKFFQVFGRGLKQGKRPWTGNDTVLGVLRRLQLENDVREFSLTQVLLVRPERDGRPGEPAVIDFKALLDGHDLSQNYLLNEGDILNLRESPGTFLVFRSEEAERTEQEQRILQNAEQRDLLRKPYLSK